MNRAEYLAIAELQRGIARLGGAIRFAEDKAAVAHEERIDPVVLLHYDALATLEGMRRAEAHLRGQPYTPLPPNPVFAQVKALDGVADAVKRLGAALDNRATP